MADLPRRLALKWKVPVLNLSAAKIQDKKLTESAVYRKILYFERD